MKFEKYLNLPSLTWDNFKSPVFCVQISEYKYFLNRIDEKDIEKILK